MRSRDDLPAPLRPRIVRLSPDATEKLTPANTSRPPRRQVTSVAESRINNVPQQAAKAESAAREKAREPAMSGMLSSISCRSGTSLEKLL
jgi:hypothetical protein